MTIGAYLTPLLPELIVLIGACAVLFVGVLPGTRRSSATAAIALVTVAAGLAAALWLGDPTGQARTDAVLPGLSFTSITYYVRWVTLSLGAVFVLANWQQAVDEERGEYLAMILFSLLGVLLTASASDLLVLFFAIELVSVPTYVLIALSRLDSRASEASVKYFFLGALSAAILAYGMTFLYGQCGSTSLDVLAGYLPATRDGAAGLAPQAMIGILLVLGGLAFKIAAVPFHVYAPDVYEGAAAPVTGLLGFVPKIAGFVALIKLMSVLNWTLPANLFWVLWLLAAVTMTAGNVLALLQKNVKRTLAYSSIAHTGYMLIALLVGPVSGEGPMRDGVSALLFYIAAYGVMNYGAFALLACFEIEGRAVETFDELGGLATRAPGLAFAFAVCVFSLMGFPPTVGLMGKWYVFGSAFSVGAEHAFHQPLLWLAVLGVINSAIGAAYYVRIVASCYFGGDSRPVSAVGGAGPRWALGLCCFPTLVLFAWPIGLARPAKNATAIVHNQVGGLPRRAAAMITERPLGPDSTAAASP